MALISKFKISRLPFRSSLVIQGAPVVLNQQYNIALESSLIAISNGVGTPYDDFEFQLMSSDGVSTGSYICTINTKAAIGVLNSTNQSFDVPKDELIVVPIVFENTVAGVVFTGYSLRNGTLFINGDEVVIGQFYLKYQLEDIKFITTYAADAIDVTTSINMEKYNNDSNTQTVVISLISTANISALIEAESIVIGTLTNATP